MVECWRIKNSPSVTRRGRSSFLLRPPLADCATSSATAILTHRLEI